MIEKVIEASAKNIRAWRHSAPQEFESILAVELHTVASHAYQAAMKAQCEHCRSGSFERGSWLRGEWMHRTADGDEFACKASRIRSLKDSLVFESLASSLP